MCLARRCLAMDVFSGSTIPAFRCHVTLPLPWGYLSWMAYRHTPISSFPRAVLAISVIGLTFFPMARLVRSCCSLLKATHSELLPDKVPVGPGLSPSSYFSNPRGQCSLERTELLHLCLLLCVQTPFPFWRGLTPWQCPVPHFSNPDGRSCYSLIANIPLRSEESTSRIQI
jgi:hypothetical protein